uniref:Tail tape measure n=1 Tax=Salmonella phage vB_SE130_2P TaxID=3236707 RepID=A0AB39C5F7_9VIRU
MADTASLIARVKTEGVRQAAQELDKVIHVSQHRRGRCPKLTPAVEKTNSATSKAAGDGLSKFRNAAGQVGFQVQDMVVQLQSGTYIGVRRYRAAGFTVGRGIWAWRCGTRRDNCISFCRWRGSGTNP